MILFMTASFRSDLSCKGGPGPSLLDHLLGFLMNCGSLALSGRLLSGGSLQADGLLYPLGFLPIIVFALFQVKARARLQ